jgi:CO dehydrogenase maturation factor
VSGSESDRSLRVALIGSGGVGKSMVSATLARTLARRGRQVLAVDLDPNPGLAYSLGLSPSDDGLPPESTVRVDEGGLYGWGPAPGLDLANGAITLSRAAPDGVRYLSPGKIDGSGDAKNEVKRCLGTVRQLVDSLVDPWDMVLDLEAGTTTPYEGYARVADVLLVLTTGAWRSCLAARRLSALFPDVRQIVVATKTAPGATDAVRWGLPVRHRIPFDPAVADAERHGLSPLDACPGAPALSAVESLADLLLEENAMTLAPADTRIGT